jgi:hypothetical protein
MPTEKSGHLEKPTFVLKTHEDEAVSLLKDNLLFNDKEPDKIYQLFHMEHPDDAKDSDPHFFNLGHWKANTSEP